MILVLKRCYYLISFVILGQTSCQNSNSSKLEIQKWIRQNEIQLYYQMQTTLTDEIKAIHTDSDLSFRSFVFTKYDSTILGTLASKINNLDTCLETEYKIYHNEDKVDLIISRPFDDKCSVDRKFTSDTLSLKYFRLIFL